MNYFSLPKLFLGFIAALLFSFDISARDCQNSLNKSFLVCKNLVNECNELVKKGLSYNNVYNYTQKINQNSDNEGRLLIRLVTRNNREKTYLCANDMKVVFVRIELYAESRNAETRNEFKDAIKTLANDFISLSNFSKPQKKEIDRLMNRFGNLLIKIVNQKGSEETKKEAISTFQEVLRIVINRLC